MTNIYLPEREMVKTAFNLFHKKIIRDGFSFHSEPR